MARSATAIWGAACGARPAGNMIDVLSSVCLSLVAAPAQGRSDRSFITAGKAKPGAKRMNVIGVARTIAVSSSVGCSACNNVIGGFFFVSSSRLLYMYTGMRENPLFGLR